MNPFDNDPINIDPIDFEKQVKVFFESMDSKPKKMEFVHDAKVSAYDGNYQIDVLITFEQLGVDFKVLVECKRYSSAIKRETVQILKDKVESIGAQKGILVSASGFQKGAIQYAKLHGIALLRIIKGKMTYETRSLDKTNNIPDWLDFEDFYFQRIEQKESHSVSVSLLTEDRLDHFEKELNMA